VKHGMVYYNFICCCSEGCDTLYERTAQAWRGMSRPKHTYAEGVSQGVRNAIGRVKIQIFVPAYFLDAPLLFVSDNCDSEI
jgi:hypothetical protein